MKPNRYPFMRSWPTSNKGARAKARIVGAAVAGGRAVPRRVRSRLARLARLQARMRWSPFGKGLVENCVQSAVMAAMGEAAAAARLFVEKMKAEGREVLVLDDEVVIVLSDVDQPLDAYTNAAEVLWPKVEEA